MRTTGSVGIWLEFFFFYYSYHLSSLVSKHKFILLEFTLKDLVEFPDNTRIPESQKKKVRISGKYMLKMLMEFQLRRDIHIMFCGDKYNAFLTLSSLFKRLNEMYN